MSSPWASNHASAICAGVPPRLAGDRPDLVDDAQVAFEVAAGNARVGAPPVVGVQPFEGADLIGEEAVPERGIGHQADTKLAQQRQDLGLGVTGPQRVLGLDRGHRVDGVGTADGLRPRLRQSDVADLAFCHELRQRPTVSSMGVSRSTRCW